MKIRVSREACCAADDQMGPLEITYELDAESPLSALMECIRNSRFLQFSSTHNHLFGEVGEACLIEAWPGEMKLASHVRTGDSVGALIGPRTLHFRFRSAD